MSVQWYCPSCRRKLPDGESTLECPSCDVDFGAEAVWGPVTNDRGEWTPRPKNDTDDRPSLGYAIFRMISRLLVGALVWLAIMTLSLLSAVPYGGGSQGLFQLWQIATWAIPVWAAVPVIETMYKMIIKSGK